MDILKEAIKLLSSSVLDMVGIRALSPIEELSITQEMCYDSDLDKSLGRLGQLEKVEKNTVSPLEELSTTQEASPDSDLDKSLGKPGQLEKVEKNTVSPLEELSATQEVLLDTDLNKSLGKLKEQSESLNIERIEKPKLSFEQQTMNNFELEKWRANPENAAKLVLGKPHSSEVLRYNLSVVTGENPELSAAHHLVGNETPYAAQKLEKFGIDRNDPANGIFVPTCEESSCNGSLHTGRHLKSYYESVEQAFQNVESKEEALEVLQALKEDIFNKKLHLQY